jgi:beta-galactosidase
VVYLHIDLVTREAAPLIPAGHIVCRAERILRGAPLLLNGGLRGAVEPDHAADSFATANFATAKLATENFAIAKLTESFEPSLFRVPVQNDGLKTFMHLRGDPAASFYYYNQAMFPWLDLDLMHLRRLEEKTEETLWEGRRARRYTALLAAGKGAVDASRKLGRYTCVIAPDDPLVMEICFDLDPGLPELPRVGISAKVPAFYDAISWLGAGNEESYPDRMAAAFLGEYRAAPAELEVPYIVPQENGNRSGVHRVTLSGDAVPPGVKPSLSIRPESPVNLIVSRYTQENLFKALHTIDLVDVSAGENGYYFLNIDIAQRGVGTATCGPDTRPEYRVWGGLYKMRLYIS